MFSKGKGKPGSLTIAAFIVVALVTLVAVAAGCGSDSSEAAPLTKSAFVKEANEICVAATKERGQATKQLDDEGEGGADEVSAGTEALTAPVQTMAEELGDLGAPKGDEKEVEQIVDAFEAGVAELEDEPVGTDAASAFAEANEMAAAYGLSDCSV